MKTLLTLIFILSSTLSYSAGTDSGGNSSSNDPKGPSSNNNLGELYFETNRKDVARSLLDRLGIVAGESSNEYKELYNLLN